MLLFCGVATATLSGCGGPAAHEAKYLKRGSEYLAKKDYDKAIIEFRNAARIVPHDAEPIYQLGLVAEARGELRAAFGAFAQAVQQDKNHYPSLIKLSGYFLAANQLDDADRELQVALKLRPDDPTAHALHAAVLLRRQDYAACEAEANQALAKDPNSIPAISVLVGLYVAKNDVKAASDMLETGISRNPKEGSLLRLKIEVFKKFNDPDKVEATYQEAIKLQPTDDQLRASAVTYLVSQSKLDAAEKLLRDGQAQQPDDKRLKQMLVVFLSEQRGLDAAEAQVHAFMKNEPGTDDYYFWLTDVYLKHQAADKAVALLDQLVKAKGDQAIGLEARTSLAQITLVRGNRDLATKLIALVLDKDPQNERALFIRAGLSYDEGQYESAVTDLRAILHTHPRTPDALQLLAETLLKLGLLDLALDTQSQLVDQAPTNIDARIRLAQFYHLTHDSNRALDTLAAITKSAPNHLVAWEATARVANDTGDWAVADAAIKHLEAAPDQQLSANYLRAEFLRRQGKYDEASKKYMEVVTANPATQPARLSLEALVAIDARLGKLEDAVTFMNGLKSDEPYVHTLLGRVYIELKRPTEAAEHEFDLAIAHNEGPPEAYINRARLYLDKHETDKAIELLKQADKLAPGNYEAAHLLASVDVSIGKPADAMEVYESLLSRNPNLDVAANNLAGIIADYNYSNLSELERARALAERFQSSKNPAFLDTLGWVYFRLGKMTEANSYLGQSAAAPNASPEMHYHYGAALARLGQKERAKEQVTLGIGKDASYPTLNDAKKLASEL